MTAGAMDASGPVVEGHQLLVGPLGTENATGPAERNVSCSCGAWSGVAGAEFAALLAARAAWLQHVVGARRSRGRRAAL